MVGRIHEDDIALVRERARIDDVVAGYLQLKPAGGGSLKGLCPFHDEKTPSFQVTPARGLFYCFGCGEGGDVITFEQKLNNLSFSEAVQTLADKYDVQLRFVDDGTPAPEPGLRNKMLAANQAAAQFYAAQITTSEAIIFRQFVAGRGFDRAAAEHFGMGYAPKDGRALHRHLNKAGFSDDTLIKAGLIRANGWDYFQGRVLWPIRDSASSVLGFGARRVFDDDRLPAKYINTPETLLYKKSNVLYGLDLARQPIGRKSQVVVVEGYTDVMACHLSGVDTAVASCGTAFGAEHARLVQRLMGNHDAFHGEVVFTFDGDQAGQHAALKVFSLDQTFTMQTYVAVEKSGLDPCDLRLQRGEAAIRDLIGRRVPLYRFVMSNIVRQYDLDRADARVAAVRDAAPLLRSVRDGSMMGSFLHELSQLVGMDVEEVRRIVSQANRRKPAAEPPAQRHQVQPAGSATPAVAGLAGDWPDPDDRNLAIERGCLKLMLQAPELFDSPWNGVQLSDFTHPAYRMVFKAILSRPYDGPGWSEQVQTSLEDASMQPLVIALLVEPTLQEPDEGYAGAYVARLQLLSTLRELASLRSKLQRINPVSDEAEHKRAFARLMELELKRRHLAQEAAGSDE